MRTDRSIIRVHIARKGAAVSAIAAVATASLMGSARPSAAQEDGIRLLPHGPPGEAIAIPEREPEVRPPRTRETRDRDRTRVPARRGSGSEGEAERPSLAELPVHPEVFEIEQASRNGVVIRYGGYVGDGGAMILMRSKPNWHDIRSIGVRLHEGVQNPTRRTYTYTDTDIEPGTRYCYRAVSSYDGERSLHQGDCVDIAGPPTDPIQVGLAYRIGPWPDASGERCTGSIGWRFEPLDLTGTDGHDRSFEQVEEYDVRARQTGPSEAWCLVDAVADERVRAGDWEVQATTRIWSTRCEATLEDDGTANIVRFTRGEQGCAVGARWP